MHLHFLSVISSPQNVPEDKHELPSSQPQTPSGVVVISETVKITTVTCETEVTNKVTTRDCSENHSEAGKRMGEENQDVDCNQVVFSKAKVSQSCSEQNLITSE